MTLSDGYARFVPPPPAGVDVTSSRHELAGLPVHLEHLGARDAPVRALLVHGAGGNAEAMRPYARHLAALGVRVTVPDLPGYGGSRPPRPGAVRYADWGRVLVDLVEAERDDRPLLLVGASLGGMLAYDVAARTGDAAALAVTCLLDPRSPRVRGRLSPHPMFGRIAGPLLRVVAGPLASWRLPIRWIANMRAIANDPGLVRAVARDRRGGGGLVSLGWMRSYLESAPAVEPELFTTPTWLLHPREDRWTPVAISREFSDRFPTPATVVLLENCGHFPLEQPGFTALIDELRGIVQTISR